MKGNLHVRFLEEWEGAIPPSYSAICTDTIIHVSGQFAKNLFMRKPRRAPNGLISCAPPLAGFPGAAWWAEHRGGYGDRGTRRSERFHESCCSNPFDPIYTI
jgi:hypothetical protein